ncbi:DUF4136 domain-containing protein [Ramlibacter humi]|uniref:DUF4136 domain-containing protein n=1 Tax=Ramlibacter humi TaxID=2530451 RepID=A0A4Z0BJZ9_9BURK|nr:DUF4136 domain-containing protein [Ramlibacter humi]
MPRSFAAFAALAAVLLSGCAAGYLMDNTVQSFSGLQGGLPNAPTYTFERLPSQANQPSHELVEKLADPALFKAGLRRDDASPRYTVQVSARIQRAVSPWADPWDPWGGWGGSFAYGGPRAGFGLGWGGPFPRMDQAWFQREVNLLVRERAGNKVVYETRAVNEGPWLDNDTAIAAMFEAALQGFPTPPAGARRVDIQLGGRQQAAAAAPAAAASAPATPAPAASAVR